jgi:hypothetical protein
MKIRFSWLAVAGAALLGNAQIPPFARMLTTCG